VELRVSERGLDQLANGLVLVDDQNPFPKTCPDARDLTAGLFLRRRITSSLLIR